ncbi:Agouti-related protein 1 [Scophthalmus maximus]|uniref:Agouti-related protein n=1 Tax=Scophthalmus maximus TaxID=52904 RepID=A0A2U9BAW4_SCOMX|nr:agouti-related protein isoform X2 [Scophthalmus maximus]AWP01088.1 Agouti-related protein 1 [Scophthalmus maximus]
MACRPLGEGDSSVPATEALSGEAEDCGSCGCRFFFSLSNSSGMFGSVLLCCSFSLLRLSSPLVHGNIQLDAGPAAGRLTETSYLSDIERGHAPDHVRNPALLPDDFVEDPFLIDAGSYDEDSSAALQLQGRAMRSPRRCIPHQQSCLGYPMPCCDPCDTCYCRFFNAICYCRRVGHACPPRRT